MAYRNVINFLFWLPRTNYETVIDINDIYGNVKHSPINIHFKIAIKYNMETIKFHITSIPKLIKLLVY